MSRRWRTGPDVRSDSDHQAIRPAASVITTLRCANAVGWRVGYLPDGQMIRSSGEGRLRRVNGPGYLAAGQGGKQFHASVASSRSFCRIRGHAPHQRPIACHADDRRRVRDGRQQRRD